MPPTATQQQQRTQQPVIPALPFVASAHEHVEPAFTLTVTPTAAVQQINPLDVPAYGYIRHILLEITAAGGTGGTIAADGPWNLLQQVTLQDVNGSNIVGPMDGYALYVANFLGGYGFRNNPVDSPWFVGTAPNPAFYLRVPVEISHKDGLGALANQNSAANYKLTLAINTTAAMFSVAPSPLPTYTIRGWLEAWTLPAAMDNRGRPQQQVPPLLGTGQYWSSRLQSGIVVGSNTVSWTRLGNYIRMIAFIARDVSGVRANTVFPDPFQHNWDGMTIRNQSQRYNQQELYDKTGGIVTMPTGVFALPYNHGGPVATLGDEDPDLWLPTTQSSRISIDGVSAAAGSVQVLTNEVAPIEQDQASRYVTPNATDTLIAPAQ
jgi:hypothetical protein